MKMKYIDVEEGEEEEEEEEDEETTQTHVRTTITK